MQCAIFLALFVVLYVQCQIVPLVSMEVDSFTPLVLDRIENVYNVKPDFTNQHKDKFYLRNRKLGVYPQVESGPGSFKAEYKKQPPSFLINKFKKLLEMKKKMDGKS